MNQRNIYITFIYTLLYSADGLKPFIGAPHIVCIKFAIYITCSLRLIAQYIESGWNVLKHEFSFDRIGFDHNHFALHCQCHREE